MSDDFLRDIAEPIQPEADVSRRLGQVVAGSLSKGLDVLLDRDQALESLAVGRYVTIHAGGRIFFGMITDIALDAANIAFEKSPPDLSNPFLRQVHLGASIFGKIHVAPMLILDEDGPGAYTPQPVKTIPGHYAPVTIATPEEVAYVFGEEGAGKDAEGRDVRYFTVGRPLDMDVPITINLDRFVERSSAVFGKSGTGKTFLSRLLLAGVIKNDVAVNLIFDMHNEYGWEGTAEHTSKVKGLKQIFPGRVAIFTLDDESSRRRGSNPDAAIQIGFEHIEPEDVEMLAGVMGLSEAQIGAMHAIHRRLGRAWLQHFLDDDWLEKHYGGYDEDSGKKINAMKAFAEEMGQHQGALAALRRRLERFRRFGFIVENPADDSIARILEYLQAGRNVVLEFGRYGNDLQAYLLVANFLTRRIHDRYVKATEKAFGDESQKPRPLVITIEEAHKFLEPGIASKTIFGTIARELRKYNVTLFIVDQRPSGIDDEVMSQIGTRVTLALDNEEDIRAVFMGVSGGQELRQVLARLDSKEQALILGHAAPMPVVVQVRRYDLDFYRQMGYVEGEALRHRAAESRRMLGGGRKKQLE
ncbi:MAG TPA: ATP-binding protein [Caldilineae bacterium]|nr:ATP-binding protein [Caldilineae bacterium]HIQ12163.1 ATP-binding protein [Caldilineales bacterium]